MWGMNVPEHQQAEHARWLEEARKAGARLFTVGLVVRDGDAVLVLKRRADDFLPNVWEIPGGHVDPGETLAEAAARELQEETGWRLVTLGRLVDWFDYVGEGDQPTRQWDFEVAADRSTPLVHPEHQAARWVTIETYHELPMTDNMRRAVALALALPNRFAPNDAS